MIAVGHDSKSGFTFRFIHNDFHANTTGSIFGFSHGKSLFHVCFVLFHASELVNSSLFFVVWMEYRLLTHITEESMDISAIFTVSAHVHDAEGT